MELNSFIGKTVVNTKTNCRYTLTKITAPEIGVKKLLPNSLGYHEHYVYETINGDPFSRGVLSFEDSSLNGSFIAAFSAYSHTEDAYWERYGYWLHRD